MKNNKYEIDMCNGTIMDKLISFAFPLMLSGILQLMFNAVDIIVVGRFSGSQALAAVGSTTILQSDVFQIPIRIHGSMNGEQTLRPRSQALAILAHRSLVLETFICIHGCRIPKRHIITSLLLVPA